MEVDRKNMDQQKYHYTNERNREKRKS